MSALCHKRTSKYSGRTLANLAWLPFDRNGRDLAYERVGYVSPVHFAQKMRLA